MVSNSGDSTSEMALPSGWRSGLAGKRNGRGTPPRPFSLRTSSGPAEPARGRGGRNGGLRRLHLDAERDAPGLPRLQGSDVHDAAGDEIAPVLTHLDDHR